MSVGNPVAVAAANLRSNPTDTTRGLTAKHIADGIRDGEIYETPLAMYGRDRQELLKYRPKT
mgnify:CR=1 FL=1